MLAINKSTLLISDWPLLLLSYSKPSLTDFEIVELISSAIITSPSILRSFVKEASDGMFSSCE